MKNYAKVGNRRGKPAYRTPSQYRYRKLKEITKTKEAYTYKRMRRKSRAEE